MYIYRACLKHDISIYEIVLSRYILYQHEDEEAVLTGFKWDSNPERVHVIESQTPSGHTQNHLTLFSEINN